MKRFFIFALAAVSVTSFADQFDNWDKNRDGKLSREELPEGPRQNFDRVDRNHDGAISREEHDEFVKRRAQPGQGNQNRPQMQVPDDVELIADINYADTDNKKQTLDLLLPKTREGKLPLIVFIHGGAWLAGDKKGGYGSVMPFVRDGRYVGASVEYRFSQEAQWPAQIFDCKAAIRWLRGNAAKYNIDPDRIAVWGGSAGGHLVAMLGTSGGVKELEGDLGKFTKESSRVQAAIDFFGPSDFFAITNFPSTIQHGAPDSPEGKLIGGAIGEKREAAKSVSPVTYATGDDPPFLIAHGTKDMTVPFNQSEILNQKLIEAKVAVPPVFIPMTDAGHGFQSADLNKRIAQFIDLHLRGIKSEISSEPIAQGK